MNTSDLSFFPVTVAGHNLVSWDGFSYVSAAGRTFLSISGICSAADAEASVAAVHAGTHPAMLAESRSRLRQRVTARRRELELVYTHDDVPFDCDAASRSNFSGVLVTLRVLAEAGEPLPSAITWKCADDVHRTFTPGDFTLIALGLSTYVQGLFVREGELIALVDAAVDAAALAALAPHVESFTLPPPPELPPEPADPDADAPNL